MITVTVREDLIEFLSDYEIPQLTGLLRQIVLEYISKRMKGGFPPDFEYDLSGIVLLLDYLSSCEKPVKKGAKR